MIVRQLGDYWSLDAAVEVMQDHFVDPDAKYFMVGHLIAGLKVKLRLMPHNIRVDVGVAKGLGYIDGSHDPRVPLPIDAANRLANYRAAANAENNRYALEDGPNVTPLPIEGTVKTI